MQVNLAPEELNMILFTLRTEKNFCGKMLATVPPSYDVYIKRNETKIAKYNELINKLSELYE